MILLEELKIRNLKNYYNIIRLTIYPCLLISDNSRNNSYIEDYTQALKKKTKSLFKQLFSS